MRIVTSGKPPAQPNPKAFTPIISPFKTNGPPESPLHNPMPVAFKTQRVFDVIQGFAVEFTLLRQSVSVSVVVSTNVKDARSSPRN